MTIQSSKTLKKYVPYRQKQIPSRRLPPYVPNDIRLFPKPIHYPDNNGTPKPLGLHLNKLAPLFFLLQIIASLIPTTSPVTPANAINVSNGQLLDPSNLTGFNDQICIPVLALKIFEV